MKRAVQLGVATLIGVLLLAGPPARPADKEEINAAIERGVRYLKSLQQQGGEQDGTFLYAGNTEGATALAGLTLLECGVPHTDPSVVKAAQATRRAMLTSTQVYAISLSVLFLDRLGDPSDVPLLEMLTVRLLEGQNSTGGWGYQTPPVDPSEAQFLLREMRAAGRGGKREARADDKKRDAKDLPERVQARLRQVRARRAAFEPGGAPGDNSNTQFAILGLWVARRHGLPVDRALKDVDRRFRTMQNADGGWGYMPMPNLGFAVPGGRFPDVALGRDGRPEAGLPLTGHGNTSTATMTCAGLLGLGLAYGAWNEAALRTDAAGKGEAARPGPAEKDAAKDPGKDKAVQKALRALGATVGRDFRAGGNRAAVAPGVRGFGHGGDGRVYYFLWSLERVCVAFDLDTLGNKDWYRWGADILLSRQNNGGGWTDGEFPEAGVDTCFALLFLKRVNLLGDLTRSLKGKIKDPDRRELASGGTSGAALLGKAGKPSGEDPQPSRPAATPPKETAVAEPAGPAGRLAADLLDGSAARRKAALEKLRDTKGNTYTDALASAVTRLDGEAKKEAREALAERLSRMSMTTLADKLEDENLEVRRAAVLACAMKEDTANVGKMIDLLNDPEPPVARAALAALKSVTGKDFGPGDEATRAEKAKAIAAWKGWWQKQGKK